MIHVCPHCGNKLNSPLIDGIAFCDHCKMDVDSSRLSYVMSAAWIAFKQHPESIDRIAKSVKLTQVESDLVEAFIMNNCYSIDEFKKAIVELRRL